MRGDTDSIGSCLTNDESCQDYDKESASIKEQIIHNLDTLNQMDPVAHVNAPDLRSGQYKRIDQRIKWLTDATKIYGDTIQRYGFGDVEFNANQKNEALSYAVTSGEVASLAAVPYVIKRGQEITSRDNHKDRRIHSWTFAAPVTVNGTTGIMAVVVQQTRDKKFHASRILTPDGSVFVYDTKKYDAVRQPVQGAARNNTNPLQAHNQTTASGDIVTPPDMTVNNGIQSSIRDNTDLDTDTETVTDTPESIEAGIQASVRDNAQSTETVWDYSVCSPAGQHENHCGSHCPGRRRACRIRH